MALMPLLLVAVILGLDVPQAPGPAQSPSSSQLGTLSVAGARRYSEVDVTKLSALKAGQPVTTADLDALVKQMASTGLFASLGYKYAMSGNRIDVTFEVQEPAWEMPVVLDNFVWIKDDELLAAVRLQVPTFDNTLPTNAEVTTYVTGVLQRVLDERKIKGRVEFALHNNMSTGKSQYLFSVKDTGINVCALRVTGASAIPEAQLVEAAAELMKREYSRLYLSELANGTLRTLYRMKGFWAAEFLEPMATLGTAPAACNGITATLRVNEGVTYTWDRAEWIGTSVLSPKELDPILAMKPGELADVSKIETGLLQVRRAYRQRGYMQQRSTMVPKPDEKTRRLTLAVTVEEGVQFKMGELTIAGTTDEDADALRKKWRLQPGDVYDDAYAQQFRSENGTPVRRLTLEPQLDPAKRIINLKIVSAARR